MTTYEIQSDVRQATISSTGAELRSLKNLGSAEEYLWQADPDIWAGSAPILFPIVGGLKGGQYEFEGKLYTMPKHGLVRRAPFNVVDHSPASITFEIQYNKVSLEQYPWRFSLQVTFELRHDVLFVSYTVRNLGQVLMLFNIGSHPAFCLPGADRADPASFSEYSIQFSELETLERYLLLDGLILTKPETGLQNENSIVLNESLFERDALIFKNIKSNSISLVHQDRGTRVSVRTGNAPHLGIWAKPGASFVCIEPWWGYNDIEGVSGLLNEKPAIQSLAPNSTFQTCVEIQTFD